jgi:hypothetical protein
MSATAIVFMVLLGTFVGFACGLTVGLGAQRDDGETERQAEFDAWLQREREIFASRQKVGKN